MVEDRHPWPAEKAASTALHLLCMPLPITCPPKEPRPAESLPAALLLAAVGGSLDAFLYLGHNRVFAGAMTGNAVLCGIALLSRDGSEALHHALPILSFVLGVYGALSLDKWLGRSAVRVGLVCEAVGLLIASFLPARFPNLLFVPFVTVLAAYQVASFKKVDRYAYNSTFITGNLRTAIEGLHQARNPETRSEGLKKFRELGGVMVCFVLGAVGGALLGPRLGNHALWLPVALLTATLVWIVSSSEQ